VHVQETASQGDDLLESLETGREGPGSDLNFVFPLLGFQHNGLGGSDLPLGNVDLIKQPLRLLKALLFMKKQLAFHYATKISFRRALLQSRPAQWNAISIFAHRSTRRLSHKRLLLLAGFLVAFDWVETVLHGQGLPAGLKPWLR